MQHDFILFDRSRSMLSRWCEALSSINAYVKQLADDKVDTGVTLAAFDNHGGALNYKVIRDRIVPSTWHQVTDGDVQPRGGTPLNDAILRIIADAKAGNYDRLALVIMTDGEENASREDPTGEKAKAALDECRAKDWQVIFLGAQFDNTKQARSYNNAMGATVAMPAGSFVGTMRATATKRNLYGLTGQGMTFTDQEKAQLAAGAQIGWGNINSNAGGSA